MCKRTTNSFQKNFISQNSSLMKSLFTALVWSWGNKELHLFARVFHERASARPADLTLKSDGDKIIRVILINDLS